MYPELKVPVHTDLQVFVFFTEPLSSTDNHRSVTTRVNDER